MLRSLLLTALVKLGHDETINEGVRRFHIFLGDHKTSLLPPDTRKVLQWSVHPVVVLTLMPKSYHAVFCRLLTVLWCGLLAPQAEQVMMSSKSTEKLLNQRRSHVSYVCCFFNMFNLCKNVFYVLVFLLLYFSREFFAYSPLPVHVYIWAHYPQMNTSDIHNIV
jgi:hypothetical protein